MTVEGELTRYKTLPPIQLPSADEEMAMRKVEKQREGVLWAKPNPPRPFLLHLGLTSRTHDIAHFQENFPSEYSHYYIDRCVALRLGYFCLFLMVSRSAFGSHVSHAFV